MIKRYVLRYQDDSNTCNLLFFIPDGIYHALVVETSQKIGEHVVIVEVERMSVDDARQSWDDAILEYKFRRDQSRDNDMSTITIENLEAFFIAKRDHNSKSRVSGQSQS